MTARATVSGELATPVIGTHLVRRLLYVIGDDKRGELALVLTLTIVVAFLDFVSVGGLFPLLTAMFDPHGAAGALHAAFARVGLGWMSPSPPALAAALLVAFVTKALVSAYAFRAGFRFTYGVQVSIAQRMLAGLFARDYEFFLSQNSAVLLKNLTTEVQYLAGSVVLSAFYFISQALTVVALVLVLALISPVAALSAFLALSALMGTMYLVISKRLTAWGKAREARLAELNRLAHEALAGVKTVKAMGTEQAYLRRFRETGVQYARLNTQYQTAGAIPPLFIEMVLFGGVAAVLLFAYAYNVSMTSLVPLLGVLGAAGYRLLPAAKNMFGYAVTIRYYAATIGVVEQALRGTEAPRDDASSRGTAVIPPLRTAIVLDEVEYGYPSAGATALRGISMTIAAGGHVALVGASGSGKTTTMDVVMGLLHPSRGRVLVDGTPITRENAHAWRKQLGYVAQTVFLADATLAENITLGADDEAIDLAHLRDVVRQAHLEEFVGSLPQGLNTPVGEAGVRLSGGERQRVGIARALYRRPTVLVLDEATSSLDTVTERAVNTEVLAACAGITVLIVAHRLSTVRTCDRLILLEKGEVKAAGTYDELLATSREFAELHRQGAI